MVSSVVIPILISPINDALTTNYTPVLTWDSSTGLLGVPALDHYRLQVNDHGDFSNSPID